MTKEEAICELKYAQAMCEFDASTGEVGFRNEEDRKQYKAFGMAIEALKQPERRWIPCSERLPEENMWAICQNNAGAMMFGKYDIKFGWIFPAYFDGTVAWMPLPEPYRKE